MRLLVAALVLAGCVTVRTPEAYCRVIVVGTCSVTHPLPADVSGPPECTVYATSGLDQYGYLAISAILSAVGAALTAGLI